VIDASHGNSRKDYRRQSAVALAVAEQVAGGERAIAGVMLESFLVAGRQEPGDPAGLVYGQSVTDACMDFNATTAVLEALAAAVLLRRWRASR
jgi:3-deoxy-7-phosphoheptulonate synthase